MLTRFKNALERLGVPSAEQVMVAVSGGVDSVVLTDLFYRSGFPVMILHCNFRLRGTESEGDEAFVRSLAASYESPVFVQSFDTGDYAESQGISIQMAARDLRYEWFDRVSEKQHCRFIATAHNLNDTVETVLLNLARGTGLRGLAGIPEKNGKYIRPLLFATRNEILAYAREHGLAFREDSSNASKKYHRNRVRHDIIPLFEEINPAFNSVMNDSIRQISEALSIYLDRVGEMKKELFTESENHIEVAISSLKKLEPRSTWLYELFSGFDFTSDQCRSIEGLLDSDSGKQFVSVTHRLYKDRDRLLICRNEDARFERYYIDSPENHATLPFPMDIEIVDASELTGFSGSEYTACLDLDRIDFPLTIRKWQEGDYFFPLGMEGMKKLSDFFVDQKVPVPEKRRKWIMASGRSIVWIIGMRIDDRFKITEETKKVIRMKIYE